MLGPSGSGKSTLTLCLDGLIPHLVEGDYSGQVVVAGLVVDDTPVHVLAQQAGLVFQDPDSQFCTLTVEDEIAFGLENLRPPPDEIEPAIDEALASVGLAGYQEPAARDTLSGGEKQRVALAAVLAMGPRLLVLDEPSANLDPRPPRSCSRSSARLAGRSAAHDRHHRAQAGRGHRMGRQRPGARCATAVCSSGQPRGGLLRAGRAASRRRGVASADGRTGGRPARGGLGGAGQPAGRGGDGGRRSDRDSWAWPDASAPGAPRLVCRHRRRGPPTRGDSLLRVDGSSLRYLRRAGQGRACCATSRCRSAGSFLAIAGANGAGKSTLAALLSGVLEPPAGRVFLEGDDVASHQRARL